MDGFPSSRLAELVAAFEPSEIHWRAQTISERDGKFSALALAYIDARNVMERLDRVCGPENWQDRYEETPKGRILATLSLNVDGYWVNKSDGAGDTDVEGDKGAVSDALKRAAVKWGVGRYLYALGNTWADCEVAMRDNQPIKNKSGNFIWRKWTAAGQAKLDSALNAIAPPKPLPESIQGLISDINRAPDPAKLATLWKEKWPTVPPEHRPAVLEAKESRKAELTNPIIGG